LLPQICAGHSPYRRQKESSARALAVPQKKQKSIATDGDDEHRWIQSKFSRLCRPRIYPCSSDFSSVAIFLALAFFMFWR
jgi:hypothetical protein